MIIVSNVFIFSYFIFSYFNVLIFPSNNQLLTEIQNETLLKIPFRKQDVYLRNGNDKSV